MQHAKNMLFSPFDICHKATFKQFNLQIKIFHSNQHFSSKLVIRKLFFENETHFSLNCFKNQTKIKNSLQNSFKLPYLLEYKSHSCISHTPTLELKIGTKFF